MFEPASTGMNLPPYPVKKSATGKYILIAVLIIVLVFIFLVFVGALVRTAVPALRGRVALLEVQGVLYDVRNLVDELHAYSDNPTIRAIVVRVDSPGGSAAASQELYDEIRKIRLRKIKPIVVSMGNVAASGGYYVACGADEIFANPATLTGSFGVIMNFFNWEILVRKVGISFEVVKSGEYKDIGSPTRPMTEEERSLLQDIINDVYDQFVNAIYESRYDSLKQSYFTRYANEEDSPTTDVVKQYLVSLCDGRIFSGHQAYQYGLVDNLGNLDDAIKRAASLAGIKGRPRVYKKKKPLSFFDLLQGKIKQTIRGIAPDSPSLEYRFVSR